MKKTIFILLLLLSNASFSHLTNQVLDFSNAVREGNLEEVNRLLQVGVDPNTDLYGITPLNAAIQEGHPEIVDALLKAGSVLLDAEGALVLAILDQQVEIVELLLPHCTNEERENVLADLLNRDLFLWEENIGFVENYRPNWQPDLHHTFPIRIHRQIRTLLLLAKRIPEIQRGVVRIIANYVAAQQAVPLEPAQQLAD